MKTLIAMRNKTYSEYLSYRLSHKGHEVSIVYDGLSALKAMKDEKWDLVLIGILLEYYNGLEVIAEYKKFCATLPDQERKEYANTHIMIITRIRSEQAQRSAKEMGVSDYFTLPLDTSRLLGRLPALLMLLLLLCFPLRAQDRTNGLQSVGANYFIEHVSEPAKLNWQILSAEAAFRISPANSEFKATLVPRFNFAQRTGNGVTFFDHTALQSQLEAYLSFSPKVNLQAMYSYSGSARFPAHQASAELLYSLPKGWGLSAGAQATHWSETAVGILAGMEKYAGPFWITLKPMVVIQNKEAFMAARAGIRYYYSGQTDNYLHVGLLYGNSPEYANYLPDLKELLSLGSWGAYASIQQEITRHLLCRIGISYRKEEYKSGTWRNVIGTTAGLTYKF